MVSKNGSLVVHRRALLLASIVFVGGILTTTGSTLAAKSAQTVNVASVYQKASVVIDGVMQNFPQSAVVIGGATMVPMRSIFEKLGATIAFNTATQTVTATRGSTVIKIVIGSNIATVNGNRITLTVKAQSINNSTMVPLRFVSEAFGAQVGWNVSTLTATITSGTSGGSAVITPAEAVPSGRPSSTVSVSEKGIVVQFGKHDYGSKSQSEYKFVMDKVNAALQGYSSVRYNEGGVYEQQFKDFLAGQRWSGNTSDRSTQNKGLKIAEGALGQLVANGVSSSTIEKAYQTSIVAYTLLDNTVDPRTGKPDSAFTALNDKIADCDGISNVVIATFDANGFNTAIVSNGADAKPVVQIEGNWYVVSSGTFAKTTLLTTTSQSAPLFLYTAPTL
ncbi:copper amine oxidase N-terminal domain-containing protein [Paenibacillus tritici]|uniref:Copper amine oxidase N-terminal domain-containing protein n=1 Tax=Paenibacillus tritici TaxID=1873425 RepID=A0ABX2DX93_9BACL|nr:copper amine oxidase N-terminal domain-containing protein [Paenibacillus tritici]NQX49329.1 copper amine oxidase N-terminal domain-containing protein [Paenibacillus tritici]